MAALQRGIGAITRACSRSWRKTMDEDLEAQLAMR
jgi:hypothetical protein